MINKENYHFLYRLSKKVTPFLKQKNRFTETLNRNNKSEEANEILKTLSSKTNLSCVQDLGVLKVELF